MSDPKIIPVSTKPIPKPSGHKPCANEELISKVRTRIEKMEKSLAAVLKMYRQAKQKKDIIRISCTHEKLVRIKNIIALSRENLSSYLIKCSANQETPRDAHLLNQTIMRFKSNIDNLVKEARTCAGEKILLTGKTIVTVVNKKDPRKCFRYPGMFGAPRIILANKKVVGFGIKIGAAAEYVSTWDKEGEHSGGLRGVFSLGISGLNLRGGRWGPWIMLVGLTGGIGIGTLKIRDEYGIEQKITEYTPRGGIELHIVAFARAYATLMLRGGYQASITKGSGEDKYSTQHGGYVGLGLEFEVPQMAKYLSPEINVGYSGYANDRHELTVGLGLRF